MAVPTVVTDLSVTANSNSPAGADAVGASTGPDDYLRALSAIVRREQAQATAVASATTVDLGAIATGNYVHITGTTTITGFGTVAAGVERTLVFDGALTLTHNATSLILPGGANITTAAGDVAVFRSEGSGNWRCVSYEKASGAPVVGSYQPLDAELTAVAGLTSAANKVPRFTGSGTAEVIDVVYGTYTPTVTNKVNSTVSTIYPAWYTRVGNIVTVSGLFLLIPTAGSTSTEAYATLPIASDLITDPHTSLNGMGSAVSTDGYTSIACIADITNDRMWLSFKSLGTASVKCYYTYVYTVG